MSCIISCICILSLTIMLHISSEQFVHIVTRKTQSIRHLDSYPLLRPVHGKNNDNIHKKKLTGLSVNTDNS